MRTAIVDSSHLRYLIAWFCLAASGIATGLAGDLDTIGITALRERQPGLTGSGVIVAMAETTVTENATVYQPNPATVSQDPAKFTFFDGSTAYPTPAEFSGSNESWHANLVAGNFFGLAGAAPGVAAIEIFYAGYFFPNIIWPAAGMGAKVVNQSFIYVSQDATVDYYYDSYADSHGVLFVNGVNNGSGTVPPSPATMYNGIAVGLENGGSSTGPTGTGGRCKPDIVAPSAATSYATPYVSGSAAILIQAGARADGGNGTETSAVDPRTVKALLLNGAVKPSGWTRQGSEPLDRHFGAGVLNVNRSHLQLSGGNHLPTASSDSDPGTPNLPPTGISGNVTSLTGWNLSTMTNQQPVPSYYQDRADNYFFDLPSSQSGTFQAVCTLVWNRHNGQVNDLDLFLYDANTNALVASSTSGVDNVEHLYLMNFPAGRYVLQVFKPVVGNFSESETYALAFDFSPATFTALESWRNDYFHATANAGNAADQNDFDGDGLPNLMEYALGTDPLVPSQAAPAGTVEADGPNSYLALTVNRVEVKPGVTYIVESGNDLAGWSQDVTVLENTPARLKVRDNTPLGAGIKRFMRLRVSAP